MKKIGRRGLAYIEWRDTVAIPYLDEKFGHVCSVEGCFSGVVDVCHIKKRSTHPSLKMDLNNIIYKCRKHHLEEHNAKV